MNVYMAKNTCYLVIQLEGGAIFNYDDAMVLCSCNFDNGEKSLIHKYFTMLIVNILWNVELCIYYR